MGGDGDNDEDKEKEEEAERERLEAIREAEERRKEKHRKMEEEREKMRQEIRDKVSGLDLIYDILTNLIKNCNISFNNKKNNENQFYDDLHKICRCRRARYTPPALLSPIFEISDYLCSEL